MSRILVVDDNAATRAAVRRLLAQRGHVVSDAPSGPTALMHLRVGTFDLAVVDVYLGGMDGLELLSRVRAEHPACPVVVMTGGGESRREVVLSKAEELGAAATIGKPFEPVALADLVDHVLKHGAGGNGAGPDAQAAGAPSNTSRTFRARASTVQGFGMNGRTSGTTGPGPLPPL